MAISRGVEEGTLRYVSDGNSWGARRESGRNETKVRFRVPLK